MQENGTELALSLRKSTLENIDLCFTEIEDRAATILASLLLIEGSKLRFFIRDNFISPELRKIIDILTLPEVKQPDDGLFNFLFSNKKSQKSQKEKAREELKGLIKKLPYNLLKKLQEDMPADHIEIDCSDEGPFMEDTLLLPQTHTLGEKAYSTFME